MIEKIIIIAILVRAIHYTFQEGEIFGFVQEWFANMNEKLKQPIYDCAVCMSPWHGTYLYWIIWGAWLKTGTWQEWLVVIIGAMGVNAAINQLTPKDD